MKRLAAMAGTPEMVTGLEKAIAASAKIAKPRRTSAAKKAAPPARAPTRKARLRTKPAKKRK